MPNPITLSLRPTTINGTRYTDDYAVIWSTPRHGERQVGRILKSEGRDTWSWHLQPAAPVPAWGNGLAWSLKDATAEFRKAWERYVAAQRRHGWIERLKVAER